MPVQSALQEPQQPLRLNLENQRKRARSLLNAARAEDAHALRRLASLQRKAGRTSAAERPRWSLHHAQLVIAHELGFASWAKLKAHIESDNIALMGALVGAAGRALEAEIDKPLFVDPHARALAGKNGFELHRALRSTTWPPNAAGPAPEQSIITRYFDDALQAAMHSDGSLLQVVLFNAGMDTRAYRLRWPAKLVLFEVDDAAVFEHKEPVLRRQRAKPACDRRIVRANFPAGSWTSKLLAAGFDARRPAAFLVPGLVHRDPATVEQVFRDLDDLACSGSWLGADLAGLDTIHSVFRKPLLETQPNLIEMPLERVERGLRWLRDHPRVAARDGRVAIVGASKGAELALVLATTFPDLVGPVVAYTPSSVVWAGIDFAAPGAPPRPARRRARAGAGQASRSRSPGSRRAFRRRRPSAA